MGTITTEIEFQDESAILEVDYFAEKTPPNCVQPCGGNYIEIHETRINDQVVSPEIIEAELGENLEKYCLMRLLYG